MKELLKAIEEKDLVAVKEHASTIIKQYADDIIRRETSVLADEAEIYEDDEE